MDSLHLDRDGAEGIAPHQYEDVDCTPRSEMPPSLDTGHEPGMNVANEGQDAAAEQRLAARMVDYFHNSPGSALRPTISHSTSTPAASVSVNDTNVTGHIQIPGRSRSVRLPGGLRPNAQTTISSISIQSTESTATIRPSDPMQHTIDSSLTVQAPYPDQSYAALSSQEHHTRGPPLRQVGSHHLGAVHNFASAMAMNHASAARSTTNAPVTSIGLFQPPTPALALTSSETPGIYASPFLHPTHTHVPKETHIADVDVDPISGRKIINHYEILDELGRGTHGKVKLGRDLTTDNSYVAIKIVERFSKRRKLGRLGTTEDKVKKEVAILKKARHPNVVALLEVIDDPSRKKVYIVLEWVQKGEIEWRAKAPPEIAMVEARRYEREKSGQTDARLIAEDEAVLAEAERRLAKQKRRKARQIRLMTRGVDEAAQGWSIETAGDRESDSDEDGGPLSVISSSTTDSFPGQPIGGSDRRPSRQSSSRVSSYGNLSLSGSPSRYLPLTSDPHQGSPEDSRPPTARSNNPESAMFSGFDFGSGSGSRGASMSSLRAAQRRSSEDLVRYSKEVLSSQLDPELEFVPVMTIEKIRVAFRDTLLGLQYLHYQGIVHRDIKPPNLLTTGEGRVKISDFGVSYLGRPVHDGEPGEGLSEAETQDLDDEAKELAKTVGTPAFYAPELCNTDPNEESLPVTKAIDVWALGVTLFCMLFARTPFVDSEFVVMRQIADEEVYLPRKRLCPINPKPNSRSNSNTRAGGMDISQCRHELDVVYESISNDLHDLLKRLLIKDPRKRITLEEVRHHPWVVADLPNKAKWLEETDPSRQSQGKKIEISREELNTAVVPLSLVDRVRSGFKKVGTQLGERLGLAGKGGRRRGQSNASDSPIQSASSSSSTISQDARRAAAQADQNLYERLRQSHAYREGQAQNDRARWIEQDHERRPSATHVNHFGPDDSGDEQDVVAHRPSPPSRANTYASNTPSLATVRLSDYRNSHTDPSPPPSPGLPSTPVAHVPGTSHVGKGLFGGASRRLARSLREKTSRIKLERVRSHDTYSTHSIDSIDRYSEPTTAVTPAVAEGHVDAPEMWKGAGHSDGGISDSPQTPTMHRNGFENASASRATSTMTSPDSLFPAQNHYGFMTRTSSSSSMRSLARSENASVLPVVNESLMRAAQDSSPEEWRRADDERVRRAVQRSKDDAARTASPRQFHDSALSTDCPPSPDDSKSKEDRSLSAVPSLTNSSVPETPVEVGPTAAAAQMPPATPSSSSDLGSAVSMSISEPSIQSAVSQASSVDVIDRFPSDDREKRDPSSDDTVNPNECAIRESSPGGPVTRHILTHDDDSDSDSDSEDSDGGLVMSRRKSSARAAILNVQAGIAHAAKESTSTVPSTQKTSRSGSNNTMKKVSTQESEDVGHERGRRPPDLHEE